MILAWLILWLLAGGALAWYSGRWGQSWPRWISLITLLAHLASLVYLWATFLAQGASSSGTRKRSIP